MAAEGPLVIIQLLMYTFIDDVARERGRERVHGQQLDRLFELEADLVDADHDVARPERRERHRREGERGRVPGVANADKGGGPGGGPGGGVRKRSVCGLPGGRSRDPPPPPL